MTSNASSKASVPGGALAKRPVAEKLAMLDALRDQALTIRAAAAVINMSSTTRPEEQIKHQGA